jgi:hypothetical protein
MIPIIEQFYWENCGTPTIILLGHGTLVYLYFQILKSQYAYNDIAHKDMLNVRLFTILGHHCSWWPVTHFVLFCWMTTSWPQCWFVYFVLGVLWECFEKCYKLYIDGSGKFSKTRSISAQKLVTIEYASWWDSSLKDIVFNSMGICTGYLLNQLLY